MGNAHAQGAWTISEVERLTGLPRRDIQRCCYSGKGGLGIVDVPNSTWGRRCYGVAEMAALYVVQLERLAGESLPEIGRKLREETGADSPNPAAQLAVHSARLEERCETIAGQLARARALCIALREDDPQGALGSFVERCVGDQLVAALRTLVEEGSRECGQANVSAGRKTLAPDSLFGLGSALDAGWLTRELSPTAQAQERPSKKQAEIELGLAGAIDAAHNCTGVSRDFARKALSWAFDAPGIDMAVELWLGAGSFELVSQALRP